MYTGQYTTFALAGPVRAQVCISVCISITHELFDWLGGQVSQSISHGTVATHFGRLEIREQTCQRSVTLRQTGGLDVFLFLLDSLFQACAFVILMVDSIASISERLFMFGELAAGLRSLWLFAICVTSVASWGKCAS